ncbi:MAG: Uma2 family endonuclease [Candidatus Rokubacteria bacterium]|nr:Uma2 family endonuclease [Candidatus Rokubacteria bacterium]MBI2553787.1 Uma2 family endonuclease [Candidatus Rokubacteria bacterium]
MSVGVRTRRFSVAEYRRMVHAGILKEDDRVELIGGEIVEMVPIGPRHAVCVLRLNQYFNRVVGDRAIVGVQGPIALDPHSEPQPDLALFRPPVARYAESHPGPADLFLVIEVAESSVEEDRTRKIPMYARAGVREAWLVDVPAQAVEAYRRPTLNGYTSVRKFGRGEVLTPEAFPDIHLPVDDIIG